jgi:predicted nucleotidyltransferase
LALETAQSYRLTSELTIPLVTPALFVATKLEAYRGRGRNDPLASHDLEDLINLFDGRADIVEQIAAADAEVRRFIAIEIAALLQNRDFSNAVSGNLRDSDREDIVVDRLESVAVLV